MNCTHTEETETPNENQTQTYPPVQQIELFLKQLECCPSFYFVSHEIKTFIEKNDKMLITQKYLLKFIEVLDQFHEKELQEAKQILTDLENEYQLMNACFNYNETHTAQDRCQSSQKKTGTPKVKESEKVTFYISEEEEEKGEPIFLFSPDSSLSPIPNITQPSPKNVLSISKGIEISIKQKECITNIEQVIKQRNEYFAMGLSWKKQYEKKQEELTKCIENHIKDMKTIYNILPSSIIPLLKNYKFNYLPDNVDN